MLWFRKTLFNVQENAATFIYVFSCLTVSTSPYATFRKKSIESWNHWDGNLNYQEFVYQEVPWIFKPKVKDISNFVWFLKNFASLNSQIVAYIVFETDCRLVVVNANLLRLPWKKVIFVLIDGIF